MTRGGHGGHAAAPLGRRARPLPLTVDLPEPGVFEFKRIVNGDWEPGPNQLLFVHERSEHVE